jgi:hypothetical protein
VNTSREILSSIIFIELVIFLGALILIIGYQALVGRINFKGLISGICKRDGKNEISLTRFQLMVISLFAGFYYLVLVAQDPTNLPEVPIELLTILGGSSLIYLGGKTEVQRFFSRNNP